jgi:PEGA domain
MRISLHFPRIAVLLIVVLGSSFATSFASNTALAQGKPPPAPPAPAGPPSVAQALTGEAKTDYEAGKVLLVDGDFASALLKFDAAYQRSKEPRILWNMAVCEKNLRHYAKVTKLLRRYKEEGASLLSAKDVQEAEDLLWALQTLTAGLKIRVDQPDAEVYVDEELVGKTPLEKPIVVDIGTRKVRVTKEGFVQLVQAVTVGGAPEIPLDLKLERVVHEGRVSVTAHAGDEIAIDGKPVGTSKWEGSVASGGHLVRVTAKGMRPYETEVTLQDKEVRTLSVTLEADPALKKGVPVWIFVAGGAVVLTGAAVGGFFLFRPDPERSVVAPGNLGSTEANHRFQF